MTTFALLFHIALSSAALARGFAEFGFASASIWMLILGAIWFFSIWQEWEWFSTFGLIVAVIAAAFGLWGRFSPGWMFSGAVFALFAWDLNDFRYRMRLIKQNKDAPGIERRRLARISLLSFAALVLASVAMHLRGKFNNEWGFFLAIAIALELTQSSGWIKGK